MSRKSDLFVYCSLIVYRHKPVTTNLPQPPHSQGLWICTSDFGAAKKSPTPLTFKDHPHTTIQFRPPSEMHAHNIRRRKSLIHVHLKLQ